MLIAIILINVVAGVVGVLAGVALARRMRDPSFGFPCSLCTFLCILAIGLCICKCVDVAANEAVVTTTEEVAEITNLNMTVYDTILSDPTYQYHVSLLFGDGTSFTLEVEEMQFSSLRVGDNVIVTITATDNTKIDDTVEYEIKN